MALKFIIPFPLFSPPNPNPSDDRPATEVRFSRWNNANAQKFILRERAQKEIEDEIRLNKRFDSALRIAEAPSADDPSSSGEVPPFKSIGTPSSPSRPSIPGRASKYSKPPKPQKPHPAFRPVVRVRKIPAPADEAPSTDKGLKIGENGVSYVIPGAPFEFQYSYTETPKVKPVKLREPPYAPFGPSTMPRPWTGRAPLPPSKKKLKEFDSFRLPPPHKKGVKPVQAPGPFLPGSGPKYVMSREEILGEPLTKEEVKDLIVACIKTKRQLNIGRDGLTHNMLDNIHALWKRRRVCKIKCKGVCTVDMDNVRQQLEEKTGGKIIHSRGGVIFLFRGRNYNYRTRPCFPLMLWKPVTPVYPRLVQRAPEGLSLEEASEMRKKGRQLTPICKLAKNGVYCKLVKNVREAFEECELVRINCQGLNSSDYHKIGAKLKDLVPCVLLSFENEHILMWRGRDWKSSFSTSEDGDKEEEDSEIDAAIAAVPVSEDQELSVSHDPDLSLDNKSLDTEVESIPLMDSETLDVQKTGDTHIVAAMMSPSMEETKLDEAVSDNESVAMAKNSESNTTLGSTGYDNTDDISVVSDTMLEMNGSNDTSENTGDASKAAKSSAAMEGVVTLWKQALETGSAVVLDTASLDADIVYERAVVFAQSAPPGPVFMRRPRKIAVKKPEKPEKEDTDVLEVEESVVVREKGSGRMGFKNKRKMDFKDGLLGAVPQGSLRVDELAKLLA